MIFYSKLRFEEHLKSVLKKISETVSLLQKFQGILSRTSLIAIYKLFTRTHLDYAGIIYMIRHLKNPSIKGLNLYSIKQQLQ